MSETVIDRKSPIEMAVELLLDLGRKRGYVTWEEMNAILPDEAVDPHQLELILLKLEEFKIEMLDEIDAARLVAKEKSAAPVVKRGAGGTVFTGFLGKEIDPQKRWFRLGVLVTAVPAMAVIAYLEDTYSALIWSQVVLSIQLPLTIIPLILLTRSRKVMGDYANGRFENLLLYICGGIVIFLNMLLLLSFFGVEF